MSVVAHFLAHPLPGETIVYAVKCFAWNVFIFFLFLFFVFIKEMAGQRNAIGDGEVHDDYLLLGELIILLKNKPIQLYGLHRYIESSVVPMDRRCSSECPFLSNGYKDT